MNNTDPIAPTFEYCAVSYLEQWVRHESRHHKALQSPDATSVRAALAYFKVSRGFAGIAEASTGAKVAKLLVQYDKYVTKNTAADRVTSLAEVLGQDLDADILLSASSKLLWLRRRLPYVIYDSRAVRALNLMNLPPTPSDYSGYSNSWRKAFAVRRKDLEIAAGRVTAFRKFTAAAHLGKSEVAAIVSEDWFVERVFDKYLWIVGAPPAKAPARHQTTKSIGK